MEKQKSEGPSLEDPKSLALPSKLSLSLSLSVPFQAASSFFMCCNSSKDTQQTLKMNPVPMILSMFLNLLLHRAVAQAPHRPPFHSPAPAPAPAPVPVSQPIAPLFTSNPIPAALSPGFQVGEQQQHRKGSHNKTVVISVAVATGAVGAVILTLLCFWICHTKRPSKSNKKNQSLHISDTVEKGLIGMKTIGMKGCAPIIDYKEIEKSTNNFDESNILGEGGFGCVYKAHLDDNLVVAVKKLHCQTQNAEREFENEVQLLSKIQHPNIIPLLACSINGDTRFIVYQLMQNGSLEAHLHGSTRGSALTWNMRMKIALDTARGLEYLHEHCHPPVIHRDMKSSNILLDANFNAKLSDFGLAITDGSQSKKNIKLSGTLGYVAPEYLLDGKLTDKSDVYAFGVVLLELLLGRKPVEKLAPAQCQSIVTWAMPALTDRSKLRNIVDPVIKDTMDVKHLYQVAAVAVLCVQPEPSYRPLITDVLHSLVPLVPIHLGGTLRSH
ncbi:probable receptor-like protein kinase At1g80640 isoform X1 [Arachis hypogaea]|uniref:probable receptor-like protein kinase At1g80640 isoform X1 n=1 Tax=Arachis hypogaea TaxID=3818 RepID=UPI000DECC05E|nr:probable receptor-like protein kinase At1g80640 isoform X1 [Arachis hypogaea]